MARARELFRREFSLREMDMGNEIRASALRVKLWAVVAFVQGRD